jgi:hypothetical protein
MVKCSPSMTESGSILTYTELQIISLKPRPEMETDAIYFTHSSILFPVLVVSTNMKELCSLPTE